MAVRIPRLVSLLAAAMLSCRAPVAPRVPGVVEQDAPDAAIRCAAFKRGLTSAINPHPLYDAARARIAQMPHVSVNGDRIDDRAGGRLTANAVNTPAAPLGTWTSLGPGNIGGRPSARLAAPPASQVTSVAAPSRPVFR